MTEHGKHKERSRLIDQAPDLYERYAKPLESKHPGKFIAVGIHGQIILGKTQQEVVRKAITKIGKGKFLVSCLGKGGVGKWLTAVQPIATSIPTSPSGSG